jgi:diguanylate cyclase (GGDEF)-like protein
VTGRDELTMPAQLMRSVDLDDDSVTEDLKLLTRMAALVTGLPNAFITFADEALAPIRAQEETFCSAALRGDEDLLVAVDVNSDIRTSAIAARRPDSRIVTYAGALIKTDDGRKLGTLCITDEVEHPLSEVQLQLLRGLARQVMNLLSLRQTKKDLTAALGKMTRLATIDDLTGLLNRRAFFQEAERLHKLVARQQGDLCVAILDIDHFKKVNDTHGHAAGDAVLRDVALALRSSLRDSDLIGRIGGEEFAIAMPFTHLPDALKRLQQLRLRVAAQEIEPMSDGQPIRVTVSGGLADLCSPDGLVGEALKRADAALYCAKADGRNKITLAASAKRQRQASMPPLPALAA